MIVGPCMHAIALKLSSIDKTYTGYLDYNCILQYSEYCHKVAANLEESYTVREIQKRSWEFLGN